jgi:hypothetical protein
LNECLLTPVRFYIQIQDTIRQNHFVLRGLIAIPLSIIFD